MHQTTKQISNMSEQKVIEWTKPMLERFRKEYSKAKSEKQPTDTFVFDGNTFVISYAKYLIEYLDMRFPK